MPTAGFETISAEAGGTIHRARFIKISTSADRQMLEDGANGMPIGISHEGPRDAPLDGADATVIAAANQQFDYYPEGRVCQLEIGSGGVTAGAEIKSDTDGTGILALTSGTTNQWVGAIALETAAAGTLGWVLVKIYPHIYAS